MKVFVPRTSPEEDHRIALTPDIAKRFVDGGAHVYIERGAGEKSFFSDDEYSSAGAHCVDSDRIYSDSGIFLLVGAHNDDMVSRIPKDSCIVGMLGGSACKFSSLLRKNGVSAFSLELLPRISRAQSMDVLSSQNNLYGYAAVLLATYHIRKVFPVFMTSAGSTRGVRVLVLGAGVAGLQAIATAKRLGANVFAFDVRSSAKEQVESVGGKFVSVDPDSESSESSSGYASEMSEEYRSKQRSSIASAAKNSDIVICSALIPGKEPPLLIDKSIISEMKKGSVIIDIASDRAYEVNANDTMRGNCELSKKGRSLSVDGVTVVGPEYGLNAVSKDASSMYSRNLFEFVKLLNGGDDIRKYRLDDELLESTLISR
ncbi:NAD(P) transhydrogenase subunit alpha [Candidatus Hydrogenosomobacter endosymbioticus]|uniref:proton-translocating NAD(P)(+) transhydrogenase n=1 Tax=Candidatus Hydrogenosomobacter endosymbioticus TaxID=2558174 RepID=A0ABM7V8B0_9PROT|nr:NAD(P) transhydrogenase subunit alpha [Candidatus Hydrogenosomobacter endosymbioticus]BDB96010.1 NAD(P) transhydrogenase subunit alpha [Candidatus Hydrogenosomobacter endosymbioticus]